MAKIQYDEAAERKAERAKVRRENWEIKQERERQEAIERGKKQGWVNPKLYTADERRGMALERQGLLPYQLRGRPGAGAGTDARLVTAGGNADRPQNFIQATDPVTGKLITTPVQPPKITNAQSPYAPMVFAKPEDVRSGQANWADLSAADRQTILKDPKFYQGEITKFSLRNQQQILADPNFQWKEMPSLKIFGMDTGINWQQLYHSASSNPAMMGALQGAAIGAGGGGAGLGVGAVLGGALGWAAGVVGYDPTKEFWQQGTDAQGVDNRRFDLGDMARGAFGLLNWGAEQAEKFVGLGVQTAAILTGNDPDFDPNKRNLSWDAGASTFEVLGPALAETSWKNSFKNIREKIEGGEDLTVRDFARFFPGIAAADMFVNPEAYKGEEWYLGSAVPVELQQTFYERMNEAERKIEAGQPYREVMLELQQGLKGQIADLAGQAIADPLNMVGRVEAGGGQVISRIRGDAVAEAAFAQSFSSRNPGLMDARRRLQNIVNTPGEALKIDPNYNVNEMGAVTKWMAGLTTEGKIKAGPLDKGGLLDYTPPKKNIRGMIDYLTNLNPESRARVGQDLLLSNVGRIMASYFNGTDVEGFAKWWKSFSAGDMTQAADLSAAMANSPEFYTVLPAAKNFDMDTRLNQWQATDGARQVVTRIAEMLGENPTTMIEDMAKRGTAAQDLARLQEKLKGMDTAEARALLKEIQDGRLTADILADSVKLFSNGDVAYHPGEWMAQTLKDIQDHYDQWAIDHFKLDEESRKTLFRASAVLKSFQSVLLLGANPGYMISNVLPTMVTRAMSGVWGYMTPGRIDSFLTRMGFDPDAGLAPNRLDEGVGPGGVVDQARQSGDVIREATRGKGWLTKVENAVNSVGRKMPFNKLSRILEGYEGKQAYVIGMKKFFGEGWRRGKGFRSLPQGLVTELQKVAGPRAADMLYSAIEAGMNQQEIQNIVSSANRNVQSRALIHDAAQRLNIPTGKAAGILEQAGVFDALDAALKGANNETRVHRAFERAAQTAKTELYNQAARDAIANIEHVANRMSVEGMKAVTDILIDTVDADIENWMQHLERMGETAEMVESLDTPQSRSNLWSLNYAESAAARLRNNAHKGSVFLGVLKALGQDTNPNGRALLANIADVDAAIDNAYRTTRQLRDEHFSKWNGDWENPRRQAERTGVERQVEQAWAEATRVELEKSKQFGELLGKQYDQAFGVEAGEAARQAWEQITAFRQEMTARRDAFRRSTEALPAAQRQIESKKFWGETYKYMIAEMQRIKTEAIRRLDEIARGGNGAPAAPTRPTPSGPPAENVLRGIWNTMEVGTNIDNRLNVFGRRGGDGLDTAAPTRPPEPTEPPAAPAVDEMARLRQQAEERQARVREQMDGMWEVAERFGYDARDQYRLISSLNKYGDFEVSHYTDERLTPEYVQEVLARRDTIKAEQQAIKERNAAESAVNQIQQDAISKPRHELPESINNAMLMEAQRIADVITGGEPGRRLFDESGFIGATKSTYPTWYNDLQASVGGRKKLLAALDKIVLDAGKDKGVVVGRVKEFLLANIKYGDSETNNPPNIAVLKDLGADKATLLGALDEFNIMMRTNFTLDEVLAGDYSSAFDTYFDGAIREADAFDPARWEEGMLVAAERLDMGRVNDLIEELPADLAEQVYNPVTGETYREFVSRTWDETDARIREQAEQAIIAERQAQAEQAIRDVQAEAETGMTRAKFRESLTEVFGLADEMADAVMDITDARANAYGDAAEWYRTRIADVQDAGKIDLAQSDAGQPKGGVRFLEDGRAIIRAFEQADVTTVVHEIGHIFRRDLTGADLRTVEQWAGVKDGNWTRSAEEQFARGFERYLADGSAPTPKLRAVFEKFKSWIVEIYRAITGSPIDVDLTPQVKEVFDRLLTGEQTRRVDMGDMLLQMGYDPKAYYIDAGGAIMRRPTFKMGVDAAQVAKEADAVLNTGMLEKLREMKRPRRTGESVDPNIQPRRGVTHELTYDEYKANAYADQRRRAEVALERLRQVEAGELDARAVPELNAEKYIQQRDTGLGTSHFRAVPVTMEDVRAKFTEMLNRNTLSYEIYGDIREGWMKAVEKALVDDQPVPENVKQQYYEMKRTSGQRMKGAGQSEQLAAGSELFQMAEPTDSPAFKRWFGDDGLVDKNGKPEVVFHFSPVEDINEFARNVAVGDAKRAAFANIGLFLTRNKNYQGAYSSRSETPFAFYVKGKLFTPGKMSDADLLKIAEDFTESPEAWDAFGSIYDGLIENYGSEEGLHRRLVEEMKEGKITEINELLESPEFAAYLSRKGYDGVDSGYNLVVFDPTVSLKAVSNRGTWDPSDPNILFQDADPRMPLGGYEEAAGWMPSSRAMDELWSQEIQPLLDGMRDVAIERLNEPALNETFSRLSPEAQKQLQNYIKGVQSDLASTKMAAQRWGQVKRDETMLNYNRRTGFDQWLDVAFPYQFFYTRSMMTWAARAIDRPAILANYARLRRQQDRYENNNPERLRGKMRIEAPWMPDWMGDALYIDPLSVLFTPHNFLRPFEQMIKDKNYQTIEAERILQEWAADGTVSQDQIAQAAKTQSGTVWERALAEAEMRRESQISNPMDFVSATFGPAWYLSTPAKLLGIGKDGPETLTELPLTRTARAFETVTKGTWAEPAGELIGLLAKPEEAFRASQGLPEFGEYGDYYVDRQLANMVAEGRITSEQATIAMIERNGELFDEARERVKLELAMRVPLMGATYAALHSDTFFEGLGNLAKSLPPSLFGAGVLPAGELEFRGLKQEWNDAWKLKDAGDEDAINRFFDEHPEYEAYLAKGKEPEDRLRSFLVGQIWDGYMDLGTTDRKQATAEMGEEFKQSFLDKETRSYDTLSIETLTQWAQMLNKAVPKVEQTLPAIQNPREIDFMSPEVTRITDQYFEQRTRLHPDYYETQNEYYSLPKSERRAYLIEHPELKAYWDWNRAWKNRYPDLVPVFTGEVFRRVDTSTWNPLLTEYVADYAYSGEPLGPGAWKALEQIWINEGRPYDTLEDWINRAVVPSFLYGQ